MRTKKDEKFKLESVEELLGVVNEESAMDIEISKIQSFRAHPFKVLDDDKMQELIDSISVNGILTPAQVIALRKYLQIEKVNQQRMIMILNENMPGRTSINRKITFSEDKLSKYFPPFYSQLDMENIMIELLEEWKKKQGEK